MPRRSASPKPKSLAGERRPRRRPSPAWRANAAAIKSGGGKCPARYLWRPALLFVAAALAVQAVQAVLAWAEQVDAAQGLPGALISVGVAALPLFSPIFYVKDALLPHSWEGALATYAISRLCPDPGAFDSAAHSVPDYADEMHAWAALPWLNDTADQVPPHCGTGPCEPENQANALADLFFVGPSTHYSPLEWSADWNSSRTRYLNCEAIIPQQAAPFNHVARVFSPLIRQMTGFGYFAPQASESQRRQAADLAYSDVRRAFRHYLEHWANARPLFLSGHSQGAEYILRLLRDEVATNPAVKQRLVVAYVVGMPVYERVLKAWGLRVCDAPDATGCVVSWQSFLHGTDLFHFHFEPSDPSLRSVVARERRVCVNPLSWKAGPGPHVSKRANKGGMHVVQWTQNFYFLRGTPLSAPDDSTGTKQINRIREGLLPLRPNVVGAQCNELGGLWIDSPGFGESNSHPFYTFFPVWRFAAFPGGNFHPYDWNFFWADVRANAKERIDGCQQQQQ